jgi:hypothetical protein
MKALDKVNQMQTWDLPPNSEFVSFETESRVGGTQHYVWGELTILSSLSLEEIQDFYWTNYPDYLTARSILSEISVVENSATRGQTTYLISSAKHFDAP